MSLQLLRFGTKLDLFATTRVPPRLHVLHQRPQVHSVGVVPDDRSARSSLLSARVTAGIILVRYTLVLKSTEERLFRWKRSVVELVQTVHVLVREMSFRDVASVRLQVFVEAEPRSDVMCHVQECQFTHRHAHELVVSLDDEKQPGIKVKRGTVRVTAQRFGDSGVFVVQMLEYRRLRVVHSSGTDLAYTARAYALVSLQ